MKANKLIKKAVAALEEQAALILTHGKETDTEDQAPKKPTRKTRRMVEPTTFEITIAQR